MNLRCGYDAAGCRPAMNISWGKARDTSAATPGMRKPRVFGRGTGIMCNEAQSYPPRKGVVSARDWKTKDNMRKLREAGLIRQLQPTH